MGIHYLDFDPFAGTRILGVQVQWPEEQGLRVRHTHTPHATRIDIIKRTTMFVA